ncbi:alanine-rich protein SCI7.12c [Devosia sp. DBB001]|nr:alanine-rich protein SCI7.12c [Devosia sp. DBB001]
MSYKAIYTYAWDLADHGIANAIGAFREQGLDTVTFAGSYHAGKFLRPQGRSGKVYFPEDGTVYFKADPSRYGKIKPVANSILESQDVLGGLVRADAMATNVWLVLLHNTNLGMRHPESVVRNAFGDPYFYNLCPSAPEARAYAIGLATDVTTSYPVSGLSMEAPGFTPYAHGFHHEFGLVRQNAWFEGYMGLCFCDHCVGAAAKAGIDAEGLRRKVAGLLADYLESDVDLPQDMAQAMWLADIEGDGELRAYLEFRSRQVTSLVAEIRDRVRKDVEVAVIPSVARPTGGAWYEGSDLAALMDVTGIIEACFYEPSAARIKADLYDTRRRLAGKGRLRGILRPSFPDIENKAEFLAAIDTLVAGGVTELAFYNWGHLRRSSMDWIGEALARVPA